MNDSLRTKDDQQKQANTNVENTKKLITSLEYKLKEKSAKMESYRDATKVTTEKLAKNNTQIRKLQKTNESFGNEKVRLCTEISRLNTKLFENVNTPDKSTHEDTTTTVDETGWEQTRKRRRKRQKKRHAKNIAFQANTEKNR